VVTALVLQFCAQLLRFLGHFSLVLLASKSVKRHRAGIYEKQAHGSGWQARLGGPSYLAQTLAMSRRQKCRDAPGWLSEQPRLAVCLHQKKRHIYD